MASRYYTIKGAPAGWLVREASLARGRIMVILHDPNGEDFGRPYTGDDAHEFQELARQALSTAFAVDQIGANCTVGERLSWEEARKLNLQAILWRFHNRAISFADAERQIGRLFEMSK